MPKVLKNFTPSTCWGAYSAFRPPFVFHNVQKLNLCPKRDISKTA